MTTPTVPTTSSLVVPPDGGERIWEGLVGVGVDMRRDHEPGGDRHRRDRHGATSCADGSAPGSATWSSPRTPGRGSSSRAAGCIRSGTVGPEPAEIIELLSPGRFERFFREMAAAAAQGELTDARMDELAAVYAPSTPS